MAYLGDFTLGETLDFKFTTVGTTGAPTTLAGTPVVSAYVGNSTTQITAGITLSVDFDGVTGLHSVQVVASGANGFAAQTNVDLVITMGTVGGTSVVGYVIGSFSIENRSTQAIKTQAAAIEVDTQDIQSRIPAALVSGRIDASVGAMAANVMTAAAAAADLTTELQAGLATAVDLATVAGYLDTEIAAIKAKTDNLPAAPAATGDIPTAVENADALLGRNVSGGSSSGRTVKQALHVLRNKSAVAAGTLTVYDTDDATSSWTAAVSQDAAAEPITGIDPA